METRALRKNGEKFSLLGFGCMRLPLLEGSQEIDVPRATEMVDYALSQGVNYFDTAYMYHEGKSEAFIGGALARHPRDSFKIATKLPPWMVESEADIDRIFDEQLARCKVSYFDNYLIHNVSRSKLDRIRKFNIIAKLNEKKRQGLIGSLGFSFHDGPSTLEVMVKENDWDFAQIQLNYLDWEVQEAKELYRILSDNNLQAIIMEPVRGGALATLSESAVDILKKADPTASVPSWAIRFAASLPDVLTVLSGMSDMEQLKDNVSTMKRFSPITPAEQETIDLALDAYRRSGAVPCTACGYCMDCPSGVDIPKVFAIYNGYRTTQVANTFLLHLGVLGEEKQPKNCIGCGECLPKCPQQLNIPDLMENVAGKAAELSSGEMPPWAKV